MIYAICGFFLILEGLGSENLSKDHNTYIEGGIAFKERFDQVYIREKEFLTNPSFLPKKKTKKTK